MQPLASMRARRNVSRAGARRGLEKPDEPGTQRSACALYLAAMSESAQASAVRAHPVPPATMRRIGPWLAVGALWLAFELPAAIAADRIAVSRLRPSCDVPLLFMLWAASELRPKLRFLAWIALAWALSLVAYRIDVAVCAVLMRQQPVLYDQVFLVRHLLVLIMDLWDLRMAVVLTLTAALLLSAGVGLRWLLRMAGRALRDSRRVATLVAWALAAALLLGVWAGTARAALPFVTPQLIANVQRSLALHRAVERGVQTSPYRAYDTLALRRKPRMLWFFVESYGRVMASDPSLRPGWLADLDAFEQTTAPAGLHAVSGFSIASVSGGRSWLAHASALAGVQISHQALFQRLFIDASAPMPSLPRFFREQGYRTVLLAPSDRERAGVPLVDYYDFELTLSYAELAYRGSALGWGLLPDQYSLEHASARWLAQRDRPLFLVFNMVSSHYPWHDVPELVRDVEDPSGFHAATAPAATADDEPHDKAKHSFLVNQILRYAREAPRAGIGLAPGLRSAYGRAIGYDLAVIARYLARADDDTLAIVMGDHQPPLLVSEHDDLAVPVHVLARDPALLAEFRAHGFTDGLALPGAAPAALWHAGLFSLVVRTLAQASALPAPAFRAHGLELGADQGAPAP
jgi:hypothetical protein